MKQYHKVVIFVCTVIDWIYEMAGMDVGFDFSGAVGGPGKLPAANCALAPLREIIS